MSCPIGQIDRQSVLLGHLGVFIYGYVFYKDVIYSQVFTRYFLYAYNPALDTFTYYADPTKNYERKDDPPKMGVWPFAS